MLSLETLRAAPKVLLHDHLDGGLRPETIVELARDQKYEGLPTSDPGELARWFHASAASGSLSLYLRGFAHTIAVMQTVEAIERVPVRPDDIVFGVSSHSGWRITPGQDPRRATRTA